MIPKKKWLRRNRLMKRLKLVGYSRKRKIGWFKKINEYREK
jgi:hypothetical protein